MKKIMCATLSPTGTTDASGNNCEYQWIEKNEVEGAVGWDSAEAFVEQCLDNVEIVSLNVHDAPEGAVIITSAEGEEGHNTAFEMFWVEA